MYTLLRENSVIRQWCDNPSLKGNVLWKGWGVEDDLTYITAGQETYATF